MKNKTITVWITKYWNTKGVLKVDVRWSEEFPKMVSWDHCQAVHGNDWWRTEAEALAHVEYLRYRRVVVLEKKIQRLRNLKIAVKNL